MYIGASSPATQDSKERDLTRRRTVGQCQATGSRKQAKKKTSRTCRLRLERLAVEGQRGEHKAKIESLPVVVGQCLESGPGLGRIRALEVQKKFDLIELYICGTYDT